MTTIKSYSWTILTDNIAFKKLDKSVFIHNSTGVPINVRKYFGVENVYKGMKMDISLIYMNTIYSAYIEADKRTNPRTRLFWKTDFSHIIRNNFPVLYKQYFLNLKPNHKLKMRFDRLGNNTFQITFQHDIDIKVIKADIKSEIIENMEPSQLKKEGAVIYYSGKKYERDAFNRKRAIDIHGLSCKVCGFNFFDFYGELGEGFIEVHHIQTLNSLKGKEHIINPTTDLIPLCSNCHRMIHRTWKKAITIDQLKDIVERKRQERQHLMALDEIQEGLD